MSKVWLEIFLGKIGKYIINFITNYYYFIVPVIVVYGIFITLASYNMKRIEKGVNFEIIKQAKETILKNPETNYIDMVSIIEIDWDKMIKKYSFLPYISQESDLWVSRITISNVRNIVMQNERKIRLVLERNGIHIHGEKPEVRENLYTEYFHRLTRRK